MNITKQRLEVILRTIGSIATPNYERITEKLNDRDEFSGETIVPEEIIDIHEIANLFDSRDDAIDFIDNEIMSGASIHDESMLKKALGVKTEKEKVQQEKDRVQKEKDIAQKERIRLSKEAADAGNIYTKISQYTVIREKYEHELIKKVNEHMNGGWVPYGGVSYAAAGVSIIGGNSFIQAMVKFN